MNDDVCFQWSADCLKSDKEFVIDLVKYDGFLIHWAADTLQSDPEVVFAASQQVVVSALSKGQPVPQWASDTLKLDKPTILAALCHTSSKSACLSALAWASDTLKSDKEFVVAALRRASFPLHILTWASDAFKSDQEIVITALQFLGCNDLSCGISNVLAWASEDMKSNRDVVMWFLEHAGNWDWSVVAVLAWASDDLKVDREVVITAISYSIQPNTMIVLQWASNDLKSDREVVVSALNCGPTMDILEWTSEKLKLDKQVLTTALQSCGIDEIAGVLEWASNDFKADREVVVSALMKGSTMDILAWTSDKLKLDKNVVLIALESCRFDEIAGVLEWASNDFKSDVDVVVFALMKRSTVGVPARTSDGSTMQVLEWASNDLKSDQEVFLDALRKVARDDLSALEDVLAWASDDLKSNHRVFVSALTIFCRFNRAGTEFLVWTCNDFNFDQGLVLDHYNADASHADLIDDLKIKVNRKFFAFALIQVHSCTAQVVKWVADSLKSEQGVPLAALCEDGQRIWWGPNYLQSNRYFVLAAIQACGCINSTYLWASDNVKDDKNVALAVVNKLGGALQWASKRMRSDPEVVLTALRSDRLAFPWVSDSLASDRNFILAAMPHVCPEQILIWAASVQSDREIMIAALGRSSSTPDVLGLASESLKSDREFVLAAVQIPKCAYYVLPWAHRELRMDLEILEFAVRCTRQVLPLISSRVWFCQDLKFLSNLQRWSGWTDIAEPVVSVVLERAQHIWTESEYLGAILALELLQTSTIHLRARLAWQRKEIHDWLDQYRLESTLRALQAQCVNVSLGGSQDAAQKILNLCSIAESRGFFETWLPSLRRIAHDQIHTVHGDDCCSDQHLCMASVGVSLLPENNVFLHGVAEAIPSVHRHLIPLLVRVLQGLNTEDLKISCKFCRVYSPVERTYGTRGGFPYVKPTGFVRFAIECTKELLRQWPVAYHGTCIDNAGQILCTGFRRPPGGTRQAGSRTGRSIYVSPCPEYAAHPAYARLHRISGNHWAQFLLQVRVRPGCFEVRHGTLGNKHWPEDLGFDAIHRSVNGLEWLVEDENDIIVVGLLVRELGKEANPQIYGKIANLVTPGERGPEYDWTEKLTEDLRSRSCTAV